ncbi:hypothetical protein JAAARDRAFT_357786 [Jaapia argillacea MUCL 33604]|uniref:MARVEL domain-containing protein n=1 Tax=Jaapia argillacea MUCL 33604 TaxID=933084 RepID=A0A067QJR3_9AGAM|nr:hypothetical protein JAAARDRAFT_357786 [Jaapia argillacea MUCL 33604]
MSIDSHVRRGHPIVFGLIIFFAIIELAISAWLTSMYNKHSNYFNLGVRDRSRFILFSSIWTIVFSIAYMGMFLQSATGSVFTSVASHIIFLFLTWVFWLAAASSITAALGGGLNCKLDGVVYCGQLNAEEGFAWVLFVLTTFALIAVLIRGISAARRGDGYRGQLVTTA